MDKSLDIVDIADAKTKVSDIKIIGNGDMFQLLCKASSKEQGWLKSTKAMYIENVGCVVQSSTQQGDNVAEALTFVPGVKIVEDVNGGRKLTAIVQSIKGIDFNIEGDVSLEELQEIFRTVQEKHQKS